ncbi:hypothetical protein HpMS107_05070 [Helicobacter pylori]|jgi:hypothetical protein|uniref:hypothetical protein n=1 Tax=Cupriavidus TaxID=106589 RepID=UPI0012E05366|nr:MULTISPECIES: hypothetical protein [Cupriavidus]
MSLLMLATVMVALLVVTVGTALWRCSHPYRMRYTRCAQKRRRAGICRPATQREAP